MVQAGNDFENIKKINNGRTKRTTISVNAPLSDTIARIRNGYMRKDLEEVFVINSKYMKALVTKLKELNYIGDITIEQREIKIKLLRNKNRPVSGFFIKTYSKNSRRLFCGYNNIPRRTFSPMGHTLLSTNVGILTHKEALEKKIGGELLLEVYWCQR